MSIKTAFVGFRHGHIFSLYNYARKWRDIEVIAACEKDVATRKEINLKGIAEITHSYF